MEVRDGVFAASFLYGRFNWKKFNLNGLLKGFNDETFKEDANAPILATDTKIFVNRLTQDFAYTQETKVLEDVYIVNRVDAGKKMRTVFGGQRNDVNVKANAGTDFLAGAHVNDSLNGGPGRDTLVSGENNDTLKGGPGNDRFVFVNFKSKVEGNDVVVEYRDDKDTLLLDRDLWPGSKSVKQVLAQYASDTGDDVKLKLPRIASTILVKDVDEISDLQNDIALI